MKIKEAIKFLEDQIKNPSVGLPEEIFLFITRLTPMVNVDLLIKNEKGQTLLSWRNDKGYKQGWHIPGGIVRFKETLEKRIKKVAETEIGTTVKFDPDPIAVNQVIINYKNRGNFISFLYKCFLPAKFISKNAGLVPKDNGYLKWHQTCPKNLIKVHKKIYKSYF